MACTSDEVEAVKIIRAELLRLSHQCKEHAEWRQLNHQSWFDAKQRAERAEAELAALRARIADAPHVEVTLGGAIDAEIPPDLALRKLALVKLEDGE
jgi:hypothetical protein